MYARDAYVGSQESSDRMCFGEIMFRNDPRHGGIMADLDPGGMEADANFFNDGIGVNFNNFA